eukprot:scaffold885_cov318-Pavlova_lutheri.AAC.3
MALNFNVHPSIDPSNEGGMVRSSRSHRFRYRLEAPPGPPSPVLVRDVDDPLAPRPFRRFDFDGAEF